MAKLPRSMISLPVQWTTGPLTATVTDNGGAARSVDLIPSGTFWTRTFLAPNSGGTSESAPRDLIRYVQAQLNAAPAVGNPWTVELLTTGLVRITYGGAAPATITWAGAATVAYALGFDTGISVSAGGSQTAAHHPAFCWLPYALEGDPGWQAEPSILVSAKLSTGQEVVWSEGTQELERSMRARFCPTTEAVRISRGVYGTPYWPPRDEPTRLTAPSIAPASCPSTGWTVHETLSLAPGLRCAFALYDLQDLIGGGSTRYDVGAILADSVRNRGDRSTLTVPAYTSLVDVPAFALSFTTSETR